MKLVKTSAIAVAISALLAGPVLAQGASSDTQIRGGAQGKTQMQGGASGSVDEDARRRRSQGGATAKTGMKGTVGAGSGAPKATGGAAYRSSNWPITPRGGNPVPPRGCSLKLETPAARRPEFFCVSAGCPRTESPAGRLYLTRTMRFSR